MYSDRFAICVVVLAAIDVRARACSAFTENVCQPSRSIFGCSEHRNKAIAKLPTVATQCNSVDNRFLTAVHGEIKHCDHEFTAAFNTSMLNTDCYHTALPNKIAGAKKYFTDEHTWVMSALACAYLFFSAIIIELFYT